MDKGNKVVMTPEGLKKLKKELENLKTKERKAISHEIQKAIDHGDLSENADYAVAVERRDLTESRIAEIEYTLENVEVFSASKSKTGKIQIGSVVKLKTNGAQFEWSIVGAMEGDPAQKKISIDTPLGSALIGKKAGDKVKVDLPTQSIIYEIVSVK